MNPRIIACPDCGSLSIKTVSADYDLEWDVEIVVYECRECGEEWDEEYVDGE